jgi:predicted secreted Zn-dependent protease
MNLRMPSPGAWTLIWYCASCTAFVGCHEGTDLPFGLMGSYATRCARSALHAVFDELWRGPKRVMHREEAYHVLADILGRPIETAHISMMNATECDNARAIIEKRVKPQAVPRRKEDTRHWKHKKRKGG